MVTRNEYERVKAQRDALLEGCENLLRYISVLREMGMPDEVWQQEFDNAHGNAMIAVKREDVEKVMSVMADIKNETKCFYCKKRSPQWFMTIQMHLDEDGYEFMVRSRNFYSYAPYLVIPDGIPICQDCRVAEAWIIKP